MRVEIELAEGGRPAPARSVAAAVQAPPRRRRIDWFDLAVLGAFGAISLWVLALDLWQVVAHGRVWTGTDGVYLVDQMQYLAWIRDASHHVLASNLFVLRPTPADYFQPAIAVSGGFSALGVAPWLSLLLWKPVAVCGAFFLIRGYIRKSLTGVWPRRAALVLALFFGSFSILYGSLTVVGDLFPGFLSWGYTFGLLAVAVMVAALLAYDRGRDRGSLVWLPGLFGAVASMLHPWQGEVLILIIVGAEVVRRRSAQRLTPRLALPALSVALTALPLIYYVILGRADLSWQLARDASKHAFSMWAILLAIAPLALPAALAYRRRCDGFLAAATRVWPLAAVVVFVLSGTGASATPLHAFEGVTIPLSVLAVQGVQGIGFERLPRRRLLAALAIAAATVPATWSELDNAKTLAAPNAGNANFITRGERQALTYLAKSPQTGGVITRFYLGAVVPAETGRRTFVGDCLWSQPHCVGRAQTAQRLFDGSIKPAAAEAFVLESGARFVLADCQSPHDLRRTLGPIVQSVHRFGCASVYEVV